MKMRTLDDARRTQESRQRGLRGVEDGTFSRGGEVLGRTSEKQFYSPILKAIVDMGGSGRVKEVLDRVEKTLPYRDVDRAVVAKGEERWRNTARFARKDLVQLGLLRHDSP